MRKSIAIGIGIAIVVIIGIVIGILYSIPKKTETIFKQCDLSNRKVLIILFENYQPKEFKPTYEALKNCNVKISILAVNKTIDVEYDYYILDVDFNKLANEYDMLIIIGGSGVYLRVIDHIKDPGIKLVGELAKKFLEKGKYVAAICAAPAILAKAGLLKGLKATCFSSPDLISILEKNGVIYVDKPVVIDDHVITSQGPHTVQEFDKAIIEILMKIK